jgi:hypothetical protein
MLVSWDRHSQSLRFSANQVWAAGRGGGGWWQQLQAGYQRVCAWLAVTRCGVLWSACRKLREIGASL